MVLAGGYHAASWIRETTLAELHVCVCVCVCTMRVCSCINLSGLRSECYLSSSRPGSHQCSQHGAGSQLVNEGVLNTFSLYWMNTHTCTHTLSRQALKRRRISSNFCFFYIVFYPLWFTLCLPPIVLLTPSATTWHSTVYRFLSHTHITLQALSSVANLEE